MKMFKMLAMMLSVCMMYVDDGEGGGGDPSGGEGDGGGELLAGKYKTQDELVAGYTELQTAYSGKDEAHLTEMNGLKSPESFEAGEGWGSDNAMDNRMMAVFQEVAKDNNMPQGMYESLVNGMVEMQSRVADAELVEVQKSIANFDNRAQAMADTALKFLRPDQAEALDSFNGSKESFEAIELLMAQVRGTGLPPITNSIGDRSEADLRKDLRELNPADTTKRNALMEELNKRGDGEGRLV